MSQLSRLFWVCAGIKKIIPSIFYVTSSYCSIVGAFLLRWHGCAKDQGRPLPFVCSGRWLWDGIGGPCCIINGASEGQGGTDSTVKKEGRGDKGMGLTTIMSGRVSEEWDDDQTKWGTEDGTLTTTCNNHQMVKRQWGRGIDNAFNLTIKKIKWEWEGERVGNPTPITKITINQRWQPSRTRQAIMVGRASEMRADREDGEGGGGGGVRRSPLHSRSQDVSRRGRQSGLIDAQSVGVSLGRKNIPRGAGKECIVRREGMGKRGGGRGEGGRHDKVG
jgi:hypothetical protein